MEITFLNILLIVSGLQQITALQGLFAPSKAFDTFFRTSLDNPISKVIYMQWSALIGILGLVAIYMGFTSHIFIPLVIAMILIKLLLSITLFANWRELKITAKYLVAILDLILAILLFIAII